MISEYYRRMNQIMHKRMKGYGNSGGKWAPHIAYMKGSTVLDYGCGKGKLARAVDFPIDEYDPAVPGKDTMPEPHDCIVCTDVLEHIEPDQLDSVLEHMQSLMLDSGFIVISTKAASKQLPDGRNAHLIIEPTEWWQDKIGEYFFIRSMAEDASNDHEVLFIVEKKDEPTGG